MTLLQQVLSTMTTTTELINWALTLDLNSSWDESIESDPSITVDQLRTAMLQAYDDADTNAWLA
jgi:hypothetical protein